MRALGIVDVGPAGDSLARMIDAEEQGLVQQLVAHPAVERLAVAVLHGLARRNVVPLHLHLLGPFEDRVRGELGSIVRDDNAGLSAPRDQRRQFPGNAAAGNRGVDDSGQTLLGDIVDHVQNAETPPVGELVLDRAMEPPLMEWMAPAPGIAMCHIGCSHTNP